MYRIISKEFLTENICRMVVRAPRIASSARPGQFLIVRTDEKGERVPLTISEYDPRSGDVTIVTQSIGATTRHINRLEQGEFFSDVVGPLGRASDFVGMESVEGKSWIFIAGGVGAAPVYPQAKWLHERGARVEIILGAKSRDLLIYRKEFEGVCDELHICTDDGSEGFHGLVTAKLKDLWASGRRYTRAVAIGPMIMMKFATVTCREIGLPITVSLNALMVDGTGMCGACRVSVDGKMKFACADGPEFDGTLVDFDEALRRQGQYRAEEIKALEKDGN